MGFGNVRGPDEEFSLREQMENDGTDGGGEGSGENEVEVERIQVQELTVIQEINYGKR